MFCHLWPRRRSVHTRRVVRVSLITFAFTLLITANRAFAIITGFLPGDACFGSSLSEDRLARMEADGPVVFPYRAGEGELAGCGYSGYWNLSVRNMPVEMKANLKELYGALRQRDPRSVEILTDKNGNERRVETNPYLILIYNKDYDLRQGIGLKFNEAWMKLDMQKYDKPTTGAYWPYVTDHDAVASDWEGSARVPGLAINEVDARP